MGGRCLGAALKQAAYCFHMGTTHKHTHTHTHNKVQIWGQEPEINTLLSYVAVCWFVCVFDREDFSIAAVEEACALICVGQSLNNCGREDTVYTVYSVHTHTYVHTNTHSYAQNKHTVTHKTNAVTHKTNTPLHTKQTHKTNTQ